MSFHSDRFDGPPFGLKVDFRPHGGSGLKCPAPVEYEQLKQQAAVATIPLNLGHEFRHVFVLKCFVVFGGDPPSSTGHRFAKVSLPTCGIVTTSSVATDDAPGQHLFNPTADAPRGLRD